MTFVPTRYCVEEGVDVFIGERDATLRGAPDARGGRRVGEANPDPRERRLPLFGSVNADATAGARNPHRPGVLAVWRSRSPARLRSRLRLS